jgi:hypothetical protein
MQIQSLETRMLFSILDQNNLHERRALSVDLSGRKILEL